MTVVRHRGGWVIVFTILIGLTLTIIPLPEWGELARPEWAVLVLIYWCMALPQRVGVGIAWLVGLFQDALQSSLLGAHALAFALVAYLTLRLHQRIRVYPLWQQALAVLVLLLVVRLVLLWIRGIIGSPSGDWEFWLPAVSGTVVWPVIFILMREIRRRYRVQ
jgi:rod shape-determining protein MreD